MGAGRATPFVFNYITKPVREDMKRFRSALSLPCSTDTDP